MEDLSFMWKYMLVISRSEMIQNWSEMIQNSCEVETELGTRQVFVATRQGKASQGKSRQVNKFAKQVAGSASDCSGLWLPTSWKRRQQDPAAVEILSTKARTVKKCQEGILDRLEGCEKSPTYLLPPDTALLTSHCHSCDGALRPTRRMCRTTTPTTNESRTYCSFILGYLWLHRS